MANVCPSESNTVTITCRERAIGTNDDVDRRSRFDKLYPMGIVTAQGAGPRLRLRRGF